MRGEGGLKEKINKSHFSVRNHSQPTNTRYPLKNSMKYVFNMISPPCLLCRRQTIYEAHSWDQVHFMLKCYWLRTLPGSRIIENIRIDALLRSGG